MDANEYQRQAMRTASDGDFTADLSIAALGVAGEAGEIADLVKKVIGHGHDLDRVKLADEIGDELWYLTRLCSRLGLCLGDVMQQNIDKLWKRYPEGFSHEASRNREVES